MNYRPASHKFVAAQLLIDQGFDGSKITRELGFKYHHEDLETAVLEMAEAAIALGIVHKSHFGSATSLAAAAALLLLLLLAFSGCCLACLRLKRKID